VTVILGWINGFWLFGFQKNSKIMGETIFFPLGGVSGI
jgi:hypothetical protein